MSPKLLFESDLPTKGIKLSKAQRNRLISKGEFPAPVAITSKTRAWLESEIDAFITERIAARDRGRPRRATAA